MVALPKSLADTANAFSTLVEAWEEDPLSGMDWLPGQVAVFSDLSKIRLYRGGNQSVGKTTALLAETIWRCIGHHPFQDVPKGPIEAWLICASWRHCINIQKKLWEMLPKHLIDPDTSFNESTGFRGKYQAVSFKNGSILRIKTTQQGALNLAGATIDFAAFDEPPKNDRIYSEVLKRVQARNGKLMLAMTPVNAPIDWIRGLVDKGVISDHHYPLKQEHLIPVGWNEPMRLLDGTPCDEAWIQQVIDETLPHEVPVVVHGEWEMRMETSVFSAFKAEGPDSHVVENLPDADLEILIGIDHGSGKTFSSCAVLVGLERRPGKDYPIVHILDEVVSEGEQTTEDDADAILYMLKRNGLTWKQVSRVYGDRAWISRHTKKTNLTLMRSIARALNIHESSLTPRIITVKRGKGRGKGSVYHGCRYLHNAMLKNTFTVNKRAERMILSIQRWDMSDNEYKHIIDALRYALDNEIFSNRIARPQKPVYVY